MYGAQDPANIINGTITDTLRARFESTSLPSWDGWRRIRFDIIRNNTRVPERQATFVVPTDLDDEGYRACRKELWRRVESGESLDDIST
jgi:hypothetical protein